MPPEDHVVAVPLLDVCRQHAALQEQLEAAAIAVLRSGQYVLGPAVAELERGIAAYCGTRHAVGCASGSDALLLALMAAGIGPADEVIVPSFTFFATASAVTRLGAKVVFADIDPVSFNLDPADVARRITPATRAIIPVHLFGQCADMAALRTAAGGATQSARVWLIEDACQAIGAELGGRRAGALGDIGCLSFYPTKNLGGAGDGGMLTTDDDALAERLRLLRGHGMQPRYHHQVVGINSRLDSLQAALLAVKLPHLERWCDVRTRNAERYAELMVGAGLDTRLALPLCAAAGRHVWNQYVVRVPDGERDALREHLQSRRIGNEVYYPVPLHRQPCFASIDCPPGSLPHSEQAAEEVLALPIYPELSAAEQAAVVAGIVEFYEGRRSSGPRGQRQSVRPPKFLSGAFQRPAQAAESSAATAGTPSGGPRRGGKRVASSARRGDKRA